MEITQYNPGELGCSAPGSQRPKSVTPPKTGVPTVVSIRVRIQAHNPEVSGSNPDRSLDLDTVGEIDDGIAGHHTGAEWQEIQRSLAELG